MPVPRHRTYWPSGGDRAARPVSGPHTAHTFPSPRARLGAVTAQFTADRRGRPPELRCDRPHTGPGQVQIRYLQPVLQTQVSARRFGFLPRDPPAGRLAPTPPCSSIHSHSLARRDQRRALGHQHPEPGLLIDPLLLRQHPQHLTIKGVLQPPIELAISPVGHAWGFVLVSRCLCRSPSRGGMCTHDFLGATLR